MTALREGIAAGAPDILRRILEHKRSVVAERCRHKGLAEVSEAAQQAPAPRGFRRAMAATLAAGSTAVIAEIKHASPSKGVLREPFDPAWIAASYAAGGATCLSVLTDEAFFGGEDDHLCAARAACALPVLRKDFVIERYQVYESRLLGADCILLIAAVLEDERLRELYELAGELGMDVLVEVHDDAELDRVAALSPELLGINNRDLHTFTTDTATTLRLQSQAPAGALIVSESGIHTAADVAMLWAEGVRAFLVGEAFMAVPQPGEKLAELLVAGT